MWPFRVLPHCCAYPTRPAGRGRAPFKGDVSPRGPHAGARPVPGGFFLLLESPVGAWGERRVVGWCRPVSLGSREALGPGALALHVMF